MHLEKIFKFETITLILFNAFIKKYDLQVLRTLALEYQHLLII